MLNFVVTKVTNDFASRIGFYLFACLGLLSFLWTPKIQGLHYYVRARIGIEIIYLSSVFVGHGGNRA